MKSKERGAFVVYCQQGYWTGRKWSRDLNSAHRILCAEHRDAYLRARDLAVKLRAQTAGTGVLYCPATQLSPVQTPGKRTDSKGRSRRATRA
jgi:hypothetical protein